MENEEIAARKLMLRWGFHDSTETRFHTPVSVIGPCDLDHNMN
jgi:hypothetical protein